MTKKKPAQTKKTDPQLLPKPTYTMSASKGLLSYMPIEAILEFVLIYLTNYAAASVKNPGSAKAQKLLKTLRRIYATLGTFLEDFDS